MVANFGIITNSNHYIWLMAQLVDYRKFIEINPEIRFGKPVIKGTRISVYDVLGWLASGLSFSDILEDFPQLSKESIYACLSYAADKERKVKIA